MSELIPKSVQNLKAAEFLIKTGNLLAPSVHCSYYSCLQIMVFILTEHHGVSETKIEFEAKNANVGTHQYAITKIYNDLTQQQEVVAAQRFQRAINVLREKRVVADYKNVLISKDFANNCLDESRKTRNLLMSLYKIKEDEWIS